MVSGDDARHQRVAVRTGPAQNAPVKDTTVVSTATVMTGMTRVTMPMSL